MTASPVGPTWLSCPDCEAPCLDRDLPPGAELHCNRCGARVKKYADSRSLQPALAFALTGLLFIPLANIDPILTFDVAGNTQSNLLETGINNLVAQGYWPVAILVLFSAIIAPILHLAAVSYVTAACCLGRRFPYLEKIYRAARELAPWNLIAVFAVATVVAVVKLKMLGSVQWQQGALWVLVVSICTLFTIQFFDRQLVESRLEELS